MAARGSTAGLAGAVLRLEAPEAGRRPAERAALLDSGVREFVLNGNVPAAENIARVMYNLATIVAACRLLGPFVYRIHPTRIQRLSLKN